MHFSSRAYVRVVIVSHQLVEGQIHYSFPAETLLPKESLMWIKLARAEGVEALSRCLISIFAQQQQPV